MTTDRFAALKASIEAKDAASRCHVPAVAVMVTLAMIAEAAAEAAADPIFASRGLKMVPEEGGFRLEAGVSKVHFKPMADCTIQAHYRYVADTMPGVVYHQAASNPTMARSLATEVANTAMARILA